MPIIQAYAPAPAGANALGSVEVQVNPLFTAHAEALQDGQLIRYCGVRRVDTGTTEAYTEWREKLAAMVGVPETQLASYGTVVVSRAATVLDKPAPFFQDLLAFSNTDGVIGPQACARLFKDFSDNIEKALSFFGDDQQAADFYVSLTEMFQFAMVHNGFVQLSHPTKRTGQRRMAYAPMELAAA